MTDADISFLRRASEAAPRDEAARGRLEAAWLRAGLGWHGEELPASEFGALLPHDERGGYFWTPSACGGLPSGIEAQLVYVPGGEVACERCGGAGKGFRVAPFVETCHVCHGTGRVKIAPFYVGRFPATNVEYLMWLIANGHKRDENRRRPDGSLRYGHGMAMDDFNPRVDVTHADALAFCAWAGLRLPSAQEWLWAALGGDEQRIPCAKRACPRGNDGSLANGYKGEHCKCHECKATGFIPRRFPWGNEPPTPERCAAADPRYGASLREVSVLGVSMRERGSPNSPAPVVRCGDSATHKKGDGPCRLVPARPAGASWCGAHDMIGNVEQFTEDGELLGRVSRVPGSHFIQDAGDDVGFRVALSGDDVGFRVVLSAPQP